MNTKEQIDVKYTRSFMRKLMYWKYGGEPECAAELEIGFCAGNQAFADHVCMLLDYAKDLEDKVGQLDRRSQAIR